MKIECALAIATFLTLPLLADVSRVMRPERYSRGNGNIVAIQPIDEAAWLWYPERERADGPGRILRFRRELVSPGGTARIDVSADERFVLLLDGAVIARGPNRGDVENWQYQTYDVDLPSGPHTLDAVVWHLGTVAPSAQLSWRGGFILKADGAFDALLTTGKAAWRVGALTGTVGVYSMPRGGAWGAGSPFRVKGTGFLDEVPSAWKDASVVRRGIRPADPAKRSAYGGRRAGWLLYPSQLRDQTEVVRRPGSFKLPQEEKSLSSRTFAPRTKTEILWDLENYYCAYPLLTAKGGRGATVTWAWAEAMRDPKTKLKRHNRDEWKGLLHDGFTDEFHADGRDRAVFTTPWFRCGRWVKIVVETADDPLEIADLAIVETRYPLEDRAAFECDDPTLEGVRALCARGMQMCAHEMLFDCPFYEQQMYPGDTRVQLNVLRAMGADDALVRRVVDIYDFARREDGTVPMNYPSRGQQESVTYTMCELMMFGDYLRTGESRDWLKARLSGMRHTLSGVEQYEDDLGLVAGMSGWNFMDWVPSWVKGVAPDGFGFPASAVNNAYWLLVRRTCAEVERAFGNDAEAAILERKAARTLASIERFFWDEKRGLYADTVRHDAWSEHTQCLMLLTGLVPEEKAKRVFEKLVSDEGLARCTVYFSYYLFETYFKFGRGDLAFKRLDLWRDYAVRGLKTPLEAPDCGKNGQKESRSDCHAWGSHPLVWLQRGFAGVTSAAPFFEKVRVAPCPGPLKRLRAKTPHPKGLVETDLVFTEDGQVTGTVTLPNGVAGEFVWKNARRPLVSGVNGVHANF